MTDKKPEPTIETLEEATGNAARASTLTPPLLAKAPYIEDEDDAPCCSNPAHQHR